jgi:protein gp37
MSDTSHISWTDATFNAWIGCTRISPACDHCYAATWGARFGYAWDTVPVRTSAANWKKPIQWNGQAADAGEPRFVFCASLADVFDKRADPAWRADLFRVVDATPHLVWLLLTKRPQLIEAVTGIPQHWRRGAPSNVWMGTTVEDQVQHDIRVRHLRAAPAARRFLSMEPLLGPVEVDLRGIDWVIVGGESGKDARPMDPAWARSIRDQCAAAGVAFHFKQWGEFGEDGVRRGTKHTGRTLDGVVHNARPAPMPIKKEAA